MVTEEEILNRLSSLIDKELDDLRNELNGNNVFKLLELTKCIDHCFVARSYFEPKNSTLDRGWSILYQKFTTGWYDLLDLVISEDTNLNMALKVPSSKAQITWANSLFDRAGNVGNLKRMIALKRTTDFIKCKFVKNEFRFIIRGKKNGIELLEAEQQRRLGQSIYSSCTDLLIPVKDLNPLLKGNTYSTDLTTIQYHRNNYIDDYYKANGECYTKAMLGYDSFSDLSMFNGVQYKSYKNVITCLVSRCLKHLNFCFAYQEKTNYQQINPWNIYPQVVDKDRLIDELTKETKLDFKCVSLIVDVICLSRDKLDKMKFQPGYAPPPILPFGSTSLILSMMGSLSNPFVYLNKCLHKLFEKDRQIAVSCREEMFKEQLYNAFSDKIVKIYQSLKLKEEGRDLTDIDAIIFDEENQVLFLIQIKWMDDWGTDMYQRSSMKKNYEDKVEKWIETVDDYIEKRGRKHLFESLKLNIWTDHTSIHYIILGKHFSHFSDYSLPINTFGISWAGLIEILNDNPSFQSSLKLLATFLKSNYLEKSLQKMRSRIRPIDIKLGNHKIRVSNSSK